MDFLSCELKEHQVPAAEELRRFPRRLLAFPTGEGKCITMLSAFGGSLDQVLIVLAPTNALPSWIGDLRSYWRGSYGVLDSKNKERIPLDQKFVLIVPHSRASQFRDQYWDELQKYRVWVCIDEIDGIHNYKTSLYRSLIDISSCASYCHGLSGSPIHAKIEKTFFYLSILFPYKNPLGSYEEFFSEYVIRKKVSGKHAVYWEVEGYKNLEKFSEIVESLCIRVKKTAKVGFVYKDVTLKEEEMERYLVHAKAALRSSSAVSELHNLQKIVDGGDWKGFSSKELLLIDLLRKMEQRKNPIIIYVEYHSTRERLASLLEQLQMSFSQIIGGVSKEDRSGIVELLKPGQFHVVLMTRAGLRGINLQMCESTICFDTPFDVNNLVQLLGRQSRIGSPYDINYVVFVTALRTIDEYKRNYVQSSSKLILDVLSGSAVLPAGSVTLSHDDVKNMRRRLLWGKLLRKN